MLTAKEVLRQICPPFVWSSMRYCYHRWRLQPTRSPSTSDVNFDSFTREMSNDDVAALPIELETMLGDSSEGGTQCSTSKYWHYLNSKNLSQLLDYGFDNFKQTVGANYFLFADIEICLNLIDTIDCGPLFFNPSDIYKKHSYLETKQSIHVNLITYALLQKYCMTHGSVPSIEEPVFGNPAYVTVAGQRITSDLLASLNEWHSLDRQLDLGNTKSVLEVGAGYGRTAFIFLSKQTNIKYLICDILPALYLAKKYLEQCFPQKRSVYVTSDVDKSEFDELVRENDLIFLLPRHLEFVQGVDLFMAIDCLHEMSEQSVEFYVEQAKRCSDYFYFKAWKETIVPFDEIHHTEDSYIREDEEWAKVFKEDCDHPDRFFHALYRTVK